MLTLRLFPNNLDKTKLLAEQYEKRVKRLKALALALPSENLILYYSDELKTKAEDVALVLGNVELRPISKLDSKNKDEFKIIVDRPEELSRSLYIKTGQRIDFREKRAVLTETNDYGGESIIWALRAKEWIIFAYPEEALEAPRLGSSITLKELTLPRVEEGFDAIIENLQSFILNPAEPETVHQYRVSIRSFRSIISLLKPILKLSDYMEIQEIFRSKGREVELLRELDVLIERWDEVRQSQDLSLKEALLNERLEEEQRILGLLSSGQTKKELIEGKEFLLSCLNETD